MLKDEIVKNLMEELGVQENPEKNDLSIVKRGLSVELTEVRDIAGHIEFMTGETTLKAFMAFLEEEPPGRLGNVFAIVSAHEKCPKFITFMEKQSRRLKFQLVIMVSPLPPDKIESFEQQMQEHSEMRVH